MSTRQPGKGKAKGETVSIGSISIDMGKKLAPRKWNRGGDESFTIERLDATNPVLLAEALSHISAVHAYWSEQFMNVGELVGDAKREHEKNRERVKSRILQQHATEIQAWREQVKSVTALLAATDDPNLDKAQRSERKDMLKLLEKAEPKPPTKEFVDSLIETELEKETLAIQFLVNEQKRINGYADELNQHGWDIKKLIDYNQKVLPR